MKECFIFWHHIGREHGGLEYTPDIVKNSEEIVSYYLQLKETYYRMNSLNTYIKYDENTLVEIFPEGHETGRSIIFYVIDRGLQYTLWSNKPYKWKVDIVEIVEYKEDVFCVKDLLIDLKIYKDNKYELIDIDEFVDAIKIGVINEEQVEESLMRLHSLTTELNAGQFPGERIQQLIERYTNRS
jgi:hypothetical protein